MDATETGFVDSNGTSIRSGDWVALSGMTADDSLGFLPNGWTFLPEEDVYQVVWDERIGTWSLALGVEPDTAYNCKYMNHAISLFHDGSCEIVEAPHG